tara:strand:+ start:93 stop:308 length:216 start_codon:yes stop_codon:yes gene_type:complete
MSIVFFGVGFILFSIYLILLIWNIIYNSKKEKEENYPNINITENNNIDMDGMGNQGRFPGKIIKHKKVKSK